MFAPHARSLAFMFFFFPSYLSEISMHLTSLPGMIREKHWTSSLWKGAYGQSFRLTDILKHTQGHTQAGSISLCLHRYVRCISLQESSILMTLSLAHSRGFGACFDMKSLICRGIPGKGKPTWIQRDRQTSTLLSRCVSEHSEIQLITARLKGLVRVALCSAW